MTPTLEFLKQELRWDGGSVHLTAFERDLLVGMMCMSWKNYTFDEAVGLLYPDPDHEPEDARGVIYALLCRLKHKIEPTGLKVTRHYGWGPHLKGDLDIDWRHA